MQYRFTDASTGTVAFYEASLMGDAYDPPGVDVHRDDDGVPWFRIRKECADAFDADDRFERYGASTDAADDTDDTETDMTAHDSAPDGESDTETAEAER